VLIVLMRCCAVAAFLVCGLAADAGELSSVRSWLLLLNNDLDDAMVSKIAHSGYDMVVIDDVSTQAGFAEGRSKEIVDRLRVKPDGTTRVVIAYLNIGQAEDYRTYWRKGWHPRAPGFILGNDPEGWAGNYPVAYWKPAWKHLIVGDGGVLSRIQGAGFDGVYLDWIGGYEDDSVVAAARRDGVTPAGEMVSWVREVSVAAKARAPGFLVIAQNAAGLIEDPSYTSAIDAVAHEDIWFTGADGGPDGDCPVPRTQADVGSATYKAGLNDACRRAYRRRGSGAMHAVGYDAIVPMLKIAAGRGLSVFTVDYAQVPAHVDNVMRESRALGFVPFVGGRRLDSFVGETATSK
jgi:cysteinyl-tRNA synthetase